MKIWRRKSKEETREIEQPLIAVQVNPPYNQVSNKFHRSRKIKAASGKFSYFYIVDADKRAYDGDWVLRFEDRVEVWSDGEYRRAYGH